MSTTASSFPSLATILNDNKELLLITDANRVKCIVTGHEMPPRADVVYQHINSKKIKKAKEWYTYDYSQFQPYIVQDKSNDKKLYCKITHMSLNKIPVEVMRHMEGAKFKRLKVEYEGKLANKSTKKGGSKANDAADEDDVDEELWVPDASILSEEDDDEDDDVPVGSKRNIDTEDDAGEGNEVALHSMSKKEIKELERKQKIFYFDESDDETPVAATAAATKKGSKMGKVKSVKSTEKSSKGSSSSSSSSSSSKDSSSKGSISKQKDNSVKVSKDKHISKKSKK